MKTLQRETPRPILRETRIRFDNHRDLAVSDVQFGDRINLTTGDVRIARIVDGRRHDTTRDTLVVGVGDFDGYLYELQRVYRTSDGYFHFVRVQWSEDLGLMVRAACTALDAAAALGAALRLLKPRDITLFVRDWYAGGWFPRNDASILPWIERQFGADHCESLLALLSPAPS